MFNLKLQSNMVRLLSDFIGFGNKPVINFFGENTVPKTGIWCKPQLKDTLHTVGKFIVLQIGI